MAISDEYEILASVGFTESVYSDDFNRFNKVYKYLVQNFTTPDVKLEDVSALIGLTPTAFCRYLKKRTKKTFVEYLNDMRLGHAKKLLIEGKMKISTVSLESGFNNLSNFINQFKRSTNMLPSDYQKKYGNKAKNML
jgi:AraC-like DNA-binding protein